ncbi:hypothetical protein HHI36_015123, partial [Cryptolaemus montrouzieri]
KKPSPICLTVVNTNLSDHNAQSLSMDLPGKNAEFTKFKHRPITQKGLNVIHNILEQLSWDYIEDEDLDPGEAFRIFQQNFIDSLLISFSEKTRDQLHLVSDLLNKYITNDLLLGHRKLRYLYILELRKAKVAYNDRLIRESSSRGKTLWGIVNKGRSGNT